MIFSVYFTWSDGFEDSFIEYSAKARDISINDLLSNNDIIKICYCPIYKNGEYGSCKIVL